MRTNKILNKNEKHNQTGKHISTPEKNTILYSKALHETLDKKEECLIRKVEIIIL